MWVTMERFYFLVDGLLAGSQRPGSRVTSAGMVESPELLQQDLHWLREIGIAAVLSLSETALDAAALDTAGLEGLHLPVPDMAAASPAQFQQAKAFIDERVSNNRAVLVHCDGGQGRTGMVLAAWSIWQGAEVEEAIKEIRQRCANAIETEEQIAALFTFRQSH